MIDRGEIDAYIALHERRGTGWRNLEALSVLYAVRDHLPGDQGATVAELPPPSAPEAASAFDGSVPALGGSEFLEAASAAPVGPLMGIIDEHLDMVRAVFPKEYDRVMSKVRSIG